MACSPDALGAPVRGGRVVRHGQPHLTGAARAEPRRCLSGAISCDDVLALLSSHPISQERVKAIKEEIAALPAGTEVGYYAERYREHVPPEPK